MKRNELALLGKALAARAVRGTAGEWHRSELEMQSLERALKRAEQHRRRGGLRITVLK